MKNIIKVQLRQLHKSKLKFIVLLACMLISLMPLWYFCIFYDEYDEFSTSRFIIDNLSSSLTYALFFIFTAVGNICAGDFGDKTLYNELMSGVTRKNAFFGRAAAAIIFTLTGSIIIICLPIVICLAICGWGTLITPAEFLLRLGASIFPLIRVICTFIAIAFIVKNQYVIIAVGYGTIMGSSAMASFMSGAPAELLGSTSFAEICKFDYWMTYGIEENVNYIYNTSFPVSSFISISIVSLAASAIVLYIGASFFKRDDLN